MKGVKSPFDLYACVPLDIHDMERMGFDTTAQAGGYIQVLGEAKRSNQ